MAERKVATSFGGQYSVHIQSSGKISYPLSTHTSIFKINTKKAAQGMPKRPPGGEKTENETIS